MAKYFIDSLFFLSFFLTLLLNDSKSWAYSPLSLKHSQSPLIVIQKSQSYSLPIKIKEHVILQKPKVLALTDQGTQLILQGLQEGVSLLRAGTTLYKVIIVNQEQYESYQRLKLFLKHAPGLRLSYENDFFQIEGTLDDTSTWLSLSQLSLKHFKMKISASQKQIKTIEYHINSQLEKKGGHPIGLTQEPWPVARIPFKITTNHPLRLLLNNLGLTIQEDEHQLLTEPLIRVQVIIVEMRKSFAQNMGIEWPYEMSAQLVPEGFLPTGNDSTILARFIATKGQGRVLAQPVLLAKSGSEAEFFAGGELPVKTKTKQTQTVHWKKYGITLKIKPKTDSAGRIHLDLKSEISSIDPGEKNEGIPSLFTNTLSSQFDLHQRQTIALSGLIKKIDGEAVKQWPGWGDIPIFGNLFSSREYQEDKTELTVFVTPYIVTAP